MTLQYRHTIYMRLTNTREFIQIYIKFQVAQYDFHLQKLSK